MGLWGGLTVLRFAPPVTTTAVAEAHLHTLQPVGSLFLSLGVLSPPPAIPHPCLPFQEAFRDFPSTGKWDSLPILRSTLETSHSIS